MNIPSSETNSKIKRSTINFINLGKILPLKTHSLIEFPTRLPFENHPEACPNRHGHSISVLAEPLHSFDYLKFTSVVILLVESIISFKDTMLVSTFIDAGECFYYIVH